MGITSGRRIKRVLVPNDIAVGPRRSCRGTAKWRTEVAGEILLISDLRKYT
jgi:hypothetical protein